jgi:hypothetical protein
MAKKRMKSALFSTENPKEEFKAIKANSFLQLFEVP